MPKFTTGHWLTIIGLLVTGLLAGIGGTTAWGSLSANVSNNAKDIRAVERQVDGLAPAVVELRIAVAELTAAVRHEHEEP